MSTGLFEIARISGKAWPLSSLIVRFRPELQTGTIETPPALAKETTSFSGSLTSLSSAALQTCSIFRPSVGVAGVGILPPSPLPPVPPGFGGALLGPPGALDPPEALEPPDALVDWPSAEIGKNVGTSNARTAAVPAAAITCFIIIDPSPFLLEL